MVRWLVLGLALGGLACSGQSSSGIQGACCGDDAGERIARAEDGGACPTCVGDGGATAVDAGAPLPQSGRWVAVRKAGSPAPRSGASVVWTGTRALVWGGLVEPSAGARSVPLADGAAYDPAADAWRPIAQAPAGKTGHRAFWTGTSMIVWGGFGPRGTDFASQNLHAMTGAIYEPEADRWKGLDASSLLGKRRSPAVEWTGGKLLVWGGNTLTSASSTWQTLTDGAVYDTATAQWEAIPATGAPRVVPQWSAWTGSELVVLGATSPAGGNARVTKGGATYNPTTRTWKALGELAYEFEGGADALANLVVFESAVHFVRFRHVRAGTAWRADAPSVFRYEDATRTWQALDFAAVRARLPPVRASNGEAFWTGTRVVDLVTRTVLQPDTAQAHAFTPPPIRDMTVETAPTWLPTASPTWTNMESAWTGSALFCFGGQIHAVEPTHCPEGAPCAMPPPFDSAVHGATYTPE